MIRIIRRVLFGIVAIVLLLALGLAAFIAIDELGSRERLTKVANTTILGQNGGPAVLSYVARPEGKGPFPAVILVHEFFGLNASIRAMADLLAAEGFVVVAPDTFRGSTTAQIPSAIYQVMTVSPANANADLDAVYAWLESQPDVEKKRIGVAGFCYGGRTALFYSLHNNRTAATVVFYGSPVTDAAALKSLGGPVLGIFGGADNSISVADVKAFEAALGQAGVAAEISVYDGQPHAFVQPEAVRAGGPAAQAWAQAVVFLQKTLKGARTQAPLAQTAAAFDAPFPFGYYLALAYEHALGTASHRH